MYVVANINKYIFIFISSSESLMKKISTIIINHIFIEIKSLIITILITNFQLHNFKLFAIIINQLKIIREATLKKK